MVANIEITTEGELEHVGYLGEPFIRFKAKYFKDGYGTADFLGRGDTEETALFDLLEQLCKRRKKKLK
jgi:hypothetical protein